MVRPSLKISIIDKGLLNADKVSISHMSGEYISGYIMPLTKSFPVNLQEL
jgi:hypothetical protein